MSSLCVGVYDCDCVGGGRENCAVVLCSVEVWLSLWVFVVVA